MLVYVRPSNEHILIVRVPGAQDQHGCPLPILQARSLSLQGWGLIDLPLRASNEGLLRPRVARAQKIISLHPLSPSSLVIPFAGGWPAWSPTARVHSYSLFQFNAQPSKGVRSF
jgi:hypothetical protein